MICFIYLFIHCFIHLFIPYLMYFQLFKFFLATYLLNMMKIRAASRSMLKQNIDFDGNCFYIFKIMTFVLARIKPLLSHSTYHSSPKIQLREKFETQQFRALRISCDDLKYPELLTFADLPSLHRRCENLEKKLANNIIRPGKCHHHLIPSTLSPLINKFFKT